MDLGNMISELRKKKGLNREDLGKAVGTSGPVVGRYERGEITPSVEMAKKLADALGVSLDYLIGSTNMVIDKKMLYRLEVLGSISKEERERILLVMDSLLRDAQMTDAHKKLAS
ncbi:MAG: XRE family transcriptional regulator [Cytophagales bacterium CG17_big_fil_post_rev_8_21_14_2_50_40_13]|nr:MAG: XRE family transcriptional regulator [Cytophagales bacterium CG17_big_fil_post_rev_8_21_14_2_50_40_13]